MNVKTKHLLAIDQDSEDSNLWQKGQAFTLRCPNCGDYFLHPSLKAVLPDRDEYDGSTYGYTGRGELIIIRLFCEICSHAYDFSLANHKGYGAANIVDCGLQDR